MLGRTLMLAAAAASLATLADARTVEEAKASGSITVGIQGDNQPWGFVNSSGEQDGFDADIARAFGEYLGVEVEFMPLEVANRIPALETEMVDVLFATMAMTPERAQSMQYSVPYVANQMSVVAPIDTPAGTPEELAELTIGVPGASAQDNALSAIVPDAEILRFDDDAAAIQALLSGQVEAVGGNQFYIQRLEAQAPGVYENKLPLTALYNGAGSRLGEADWNTELNTFLTEFMQSPEYAEIYQKWIGMEPPELPTEMEGVPFTASN